MSKLTHGSVFSGIGAFDLAAYSLGCENLFNCDIDPFCRKILKYYYPDAKQYDNITTTDFSIWRGRVDIFTGGFPCQDISIAGGQLGLKGERSGLFYHKIRAVNEIRPAYAVWENVGEVRKYLPEIIQEYSKIGFVLQWFPIRAAWFGYPHRRERIFGIAFNSDCFGWEEIQIQAAIIAKEISKASEREFSRAACRTLQFENYTEFLRMDDGVPEDVCENEIKAYGNAIVPKIAYAVLSAIELANKSIK